MSGEASLRLSSGVNLTGLDQLFLQSRALVENVLDCRLAGIPTASRNCCARSNTRPFAVSVAAASVSSARLRCWVGDLPLLNRNLPLPERQSGKHQRDNEAGRKAAGEDVAPPARSAAALGDKALGLRGRLRRAARTRSNPALRLLQHR